MEEPPIAVVTRPAALSTAAASARGHDRRRLLLAVEHRAASLAAARALRASGFDVWVATPHAGTYAALSRAAAGRIRVPDPSVDPAAFVGALVKAAHDLDAAAVLPAGEPGALALAGHVEDFPAGTAVGAVAPAIVERATDKVALLHLATAAGLAVPPSLHADRARLEHGRQAIESTPSFRFAIHSPCSRALESSPALPGAQVDAKLWQMTVELTRHREERNPCDCAERARRIPGPWSCRARRTRLDEEIEWSTVK